MRTALLVALSLAACAPRSAERLPAEGPAGGARAEMHALSRDFLAAFFRIHPEWATEAGWPGADHAAVGDVTPAGVEARHAEEDRLLARARTIDLTALAGGPEEVERAILVEALEAQQGARICRFELWDVSSIAGWQGEYASLATAQPVGTPALRAAAIARVRAIARRVDADVENLREGVRTGHVATRENVERVAKELDRLLATPPADWPYASPASRDADPAFQKDLVAAIADDLAPAARRYRDTLRGEYLARARSTPSLLANADGERCYVAALRVSTTLATDAYKVHRTGLERMSAIQAEMRALGERAFGTSDVPALLRRLREDPTLRFRSAADVVANGRGAVARAAEAMPRFLGHPPKAPVEVRPYPEFLRGSAPAERYTTSFASGKLAGTYWIDALTPLEKPRAQAQAIAFHETIPGHHLQIAVGLERGANELGRYVLFSGFAEGWGLYAEGLAGELGLYGDDVDRLGALSMQAFRAARLVVDSGLNALGWDRKRAIDYLVSNAGVTEDLAASEVDRYVAWPGQASSYLLGAIEIRALRKAAEDALGPRFDLRAFHDAVLEDGCVPLPYLREKLGRWTRERVAKGAPASP
jgi:uncharacterized protein (DUF885 family)